MQKLTKILFAGEPTGWTGGSAHQAGALEERTDPRGQLTTGYPEAQWLESADGSSLLGWTTLM